MWVLPIVRPVVKAEGGFDGVVVMALYPEDSSTLLRSVLYAPDMYATVIHPLGRRFVWQNQQGSDAQAPQYGPMPMLRPLPISGPGPAVLQGGWAPGRRPADGGHHHGATWPTWACTSLWWWPWSALRRFLPRGARRWVTLAFYLLVGMVVVFGLRVMQQNLRGQRAVPARQRPGAEQFVARRADRHWPGRVGCQFADRQVYFSSAWKAQLGYEDAQIGNTFAEWTMRIHPETMWAHQSSLGGV